MGRGQPAGLGDEGELAGRRRGGRADGARRRGWGVLEGGGGARSVAASCAALRRRGVGWAAWCHLLVAPAGLPGPQRRAPARPPPLPAYLLRRVGRSQLRCRAAGAREEVSRAAGGNECRMNVLSTGQPRSFACGPAAQQPGGSEVVFRLEPPRQNAAKKILRKGLSP